MAKDVDVVAVAFAHLLAVDAGHGFCGSPDLWFGQLEDRSKCFVHFHCKIPRDFDVLLLVFAHWHNIAVINQNVRRHEHRVTE